MPSPEIMKWFIYTMFDNCLMYSSLKATDPQFFAKVLFAINSALQIH
jgi:hypothetical protein